MRERGKVAERGGMRERERGRGGEVTEREGERERKKKRGGRGA